MLTIQSLKERVTLSKVEVAILMAIVVISAAPRFWNLDEIGLGGDESVYAGQARVISGDDAMSRFFVMVSRGSTNFMLHQAILALVYEIGGFADFATRALSASMSVMTVALVFLIARELFDRNTAIISGFLMAINGYAIAVARVGLLDSTMIFFFVLAIFFYAKWMRTERPLWLYIFAAAAGLATLTKVPSLLIFPIVALTMVFSGQARMWWNNRKTLLIASLVFAGSLTPAFYQVMSDPAVFASFFAEGTARVINVPQSYYFDKLTLYADIFFIAITLFGLVTSLFHRTRGDILCIVWLVIVLLFFQFHPIKGWNYILPLVPAAALLAGGGFGKTLTLFNSAFRHHHNGISNKKMRMPISKVAVGVGSIILLVAASFFQINTGINNVISDRSFAGLREAAFWLRDNIDGDEGVMTISHGSAQYVLSLYGNLDSYPFGKFRLHTILPGGGTVRGPPEPDPLIQDGTVSYFAYYVSSNYKGDDPIHDPGTPTEKRFVKLMQKYESNLRHIIYDEYTGLDGKQMRKPAVWIYEIGKRLPEPHVQSQREEGFMKLSGTGFLIDSPLHIYYGRAEIHKTLTDSNGSFSTSIKTPFCGQQLVAFDDAGNRAHIPMTFCNVDKPASPAGAR